MERKIYLFIILGMVIFMSAEFSQFAAHYKYLESQLEYINSHCK